MGKQIGATRRTDIATEIELKLAVRARDLPGLTRALEAMAADGAGITRARLVSTYFDTPDHALARQGLALRVRERGGDFIQTVKSAAAAGEAGLARGEWEDRVRGAQPDPQAPETGRFLASEIAGRLVPLFRTEVDRRTLELFPAPGTRIEAAIDRGRVYAPDRNAREPIGEIELELKRGAATALYDVALDLLLVAPVRLERRSKSERGYLLAAAERPPVASVHAAVVDLGPALSGDDALRCIGIACLDQIVRNEAAVLAGLPEGIHQMRVAVRRLRAILAAFGRMLPADQRRAAAAELSWLGDALGPARNLDVFESALIGPAPRKLADAGGIAALRESAAHRRKAAYAKATRAVRSSRFTALLLRQLGWFEGCGWRGSAAARDLRQPIAKLAPGILERRRRVARRRGKGFAGQSVEERHRLRIALKKLRYATEMLGGLYKAGEVRRFTQRLKRVQDDLGDANDVRGGRAIVAELARPQGGADAITDSGEIVLAWHEDRLARNEPKLRKRLAQVLEAEPFWMG